MFSASRLTLVITVVLCGVMLLISSCGDTMETPQTGVPGVSTTVPASVDGSDIPGWTKIGNNMSLAEVTLPSGTSCVVLDGRDGDDLDCVFPSG